MDDSNFAGSITLAYGGFKGAWRGEAKIIIGVDIGAEESGVSFTFLQPGAPCQLHRVGGWPGQSDQHNQLKVPSLVWYDMDGQARSFGYEAQTPDIELEAEEKGWEIAQNFRYHLHPSSLMDKRKLVLKRLPHRASLHQVYIDYLRFLFGQTRRAFEERIVDGASLWEKHRSKIDIVIAQPIEYGVREQALLRSAAAFAGLVTTDEATSHIHFVTEDESILHSFLQNTDLVSHLKAGSSFALCNASHSNTETTLFTVENTAPTLRLSIHRSVCIPKGAAFVDQQAELHLRGLFKQANLPLDDADELIKYGTRDFRNNTRRNFLEPAKDVSIFISPQKLNMPGLRIRRGRLAVPGTTIRSFFDPCVNELVANLKSQISSQSISHILLVGSLGESPYLQEQLTTHFQPQGIQLTKVSGGGIPFLADGSLLWRSMENDVKLTPNYAYGIEIEVLFDRANEGHTDRPRVQKPSGPHINGKWAEIIPKGSVSESVGRVTLIREYWKPDADLGDLNEELYRCSLDDHSGWVKDQSSKLLSGFQKLGVVMADLNRMRTALQPHINTRGERYWILVLNLCIPFGGPYSDGFLEWVEGSEGVIRVTPAKLSLESTP